MPDQAHDVEVIAAREVPDGQRKPVEPPGPQALYLEGGAQVGRTDAWLLLQLLERRLNDVTQPLSDHDAGFAAVVAHLRQHVLTRCRPQPCLYATHSEALPAAALTSSQKD
mmetsp:Transcript_54715/g.133815  ORF Transcript_54715/g.133815 Transcript_54715/m.133815 type:complete len:111 (-) Transcript_54715:1405-1737(-)